MVAAPSPTAPSCPEDEGGSPLAALRPQVTEDVTRGAARVMMEGGYAILTEMRLPNGLRADLMAIGPRGEIAIIEVKSCQADFDADSKWQGYRDYADLFYFAVPEDFPQDLLLPSAEGLIVADRFGGAILRPPIKRKLAAARRKALTLSFARRAALRQWPDVPSP